MRNLLLLILLITSCTNPSTEKQKTKNKLNQNWSFSEAGKSDWHPATVPGVVHLDLFNNNLIEDPYFENNEKKQSWIEDKNWQYKTSFEISENELDNEFIELQFEGLDTYAEVYLNNKKILESDNMFRSWNFEVKNLLNVGFNDLKVVFESPIQHNKKTVNNYPHRLPSGNETDDVETKVASFTRKAAYHFGWDWGPRFVTSGIWRDVNLCFWNSARIKNVNTITKKIEGDKAYMQTQVTIDTKEEIEVYVDGYLVENLKESWANYTFEFEVENPKLWWCNGQGEPHLYTQEIEIRQGRHILDRYSANFGIRTIELINEPDSTGTSFYFKLNGKSVFMQGANYIPQDMFIPRVTDERYAALIGQVKDANMNMIRVWGGGVYESDLFYDSCDENGILVWQDFMFAGSLYPSDEAFLNNVKEEVTENINRLKRHPCIALWCGNNEIEVAWNNWGWQNQYGYSSQDSIEIWNNYLTIFEDVIPNALLENDPQRAYTSTSPLSNWGTPENFNHSSMHYWGVWHGRETFENFDKNVGRFMVEYGFQSFPEIATLKKVMSDTSLYLESPVMINRQKSYIGNGLISKHIEQYYDEPANFEEFVSRSQKTQALGMKMAISAHKSNQPHCMGTLFWQLNDCWPGPSWSVIDYYGNPKEAYEEVRQAFATQ
ncbi:MAG: beta-mannosidase [Patiriisocius sp.]|jgi:beta-mannosidase